MDSEMYRDTLAEAREGATYQARHSGERAIWIGVRETLNNRRNLISAPLAQLNQNFLTTSAGRAFTDLTAMFSDTRDETEERLTNRVYRPLAHEANIVGAVLTNILNQQEEVVQRILLMDRAQRRLF